MLQPSTSSETQPHHYRRELFAICAIFFVLGMSFSTWATRIPAIRDSALLIPATLGYVLLVRGIGTVIIMPLVAGLIHRVGTRKTGLYFGLFVALVLIPLTLVSNWVALALVMLLSGAAEGGYNVAINALGSDVEVKSGRSHMSIIHSFFGIGNFSGALLSTGLASLGVPIFAHFTGISVLLVIIVLVAFQFIPKQVSSKDANAARLSWPKGSLIWIGLIAFLAASIESSVTNWVALFFTDRLGVGEGLATVGYVCFAGAALLVRLIGDPLKMRFGARRLLVAGSVIGVAGIGLALSSGNMIVAAAGFLATGAGVALTFPMIFSAAGKEGALALASVATMGYLGGMVSQPVIGFVVSEFELFGGFLVIGLFIAAVGVFAWKARLLNR